MTSLRAHVYVPATSVHDWRRLLASPTHWRAGYSAMAIARSWQECDGLPPAIAALLATGGDDLADADLLLAIPEHKVPLPPAGGRPSQSDVFALARWEGGLLAIAVEGKVDEGFGKTVDEWLASAPSKGKTQRLTFLCDLLSLEPETAAAIPYQLVHRTASAVLEARRFTARRAAMVIQSFGDAETGLGDFRRFANALGGGRPDVGRLVAARTVGRIELYLGWAQDQERFLAPPAEPPVLGAFPATASADLSLDDVPETYRDPDWRRFALTFDGYRRFGRSCADVANSVKRAFTRERRFPDGLGVDELRACLFFEQRRYNHFGFGPDGDDVVYVGALLEEIRRLLAAR